jgi:hypothetical protein
VNTPAGRQELWNLSAHIKKSCIPNDAARFERDCCVTDDNIDIQPTDGNTAALQTTEQT